jgi:hypothetical protein
MLSSLKGKQKHEKEAKKLILDVSHSAEPHPLGME